MAEGSAGFRALQRQQEDSLSHVRREKRRCQRCRIRLASLVRAESKIKLTRIRSRRTNNFFGVRTPSAVSPFKKRSRATDPRDWEILWRGDASRVMTEVLQTRQQEQGLVCAS